MRFVCRLPGCAGQGCRPSARREKTLGQSPVFTWCARCRGAPILDRLTFASAGVTCSQRWRCERWVSGTRRVAAASPLNTQAQRGCGDHRVRDRVHAVTPRRVRKNTPKSESPSCETVQEGDNSVDVLARSHLPVFAAGIGTLFDSGCRSFIGPVPLLLWIRVCLRTLNLRVRC